MSGWAAHLAIAPILLPLVVSAATLLFDERRRKLKRWMSFATTGALLAIAIALLRATDPYGVAAAPLVYRLGDWAAPFGIVLVVDRLSALMLLLTSILGFTSLFYALARWDRAGPRFHALFLLLLMGVNGAFLTGDIFNLFVFFEVLLAASYGLVLHGSGTTRAKAGLHYVAINVATSLLFLIGVSLIYSVTGTLNMADLAARVPLVPREDLMLLEGGAAILGTAFLVKAGMWPLCFWLPSTYAAAAPPVAAMFSILSKVGIYVILRLTTLLFGDGAGRAADFADEWMLFGGLATILYGTLGVLSSQTLVRLAGHYVLISTGILLAALGTGRPTVVAAALFYLVSSTLAVSAFYLIIEPIGRGGEDEAVQAIAEPVFEDEYIGALEEEEDEIGIAIPATIAVLGGGFIFCALLLSGLPPLSGFIAKFTIIDGLLKGDGSVPAAVWALITLIILSGLATVVAMTRAGIDLIWTPTERPQLQLSIVEAIPIGILLALCLALMVQAGAVMEYIERAARTLGDAALYTSAVLDAPGANGGAVLP
ncbi:monovalent cation/H+ antiporter subunit D [Sphingomonas flavalba]|uniref:monovalent cation/H+ antiporter subunit D n=1 Tax=Sphingomonas flavalba TaxID=2559804 RepID=UPI00109DE831|nr:monovalent cation/H+ antiporter subunit D [Sphingomonas flavalba]